DDPSVESETAKRTFFPSLDRQLGNRLVSQKFQVRFCFAVRRLQGKRSLKVENRQPVRADARIRVSKIEVDVRGPFSLLDQLLIALTRFYELPLLVGPICRVKLLNPANNRAQRREDCQ